jgi:hypothetical protein
MFIKNVVRRFFIKSSNKNVFAIFLLNLQKKTLRNIFFIKFLIKNVFATFIKKNVVRRFLLNV